MKQETKEVLERLQKVIDKKPFAHIENIDEFIDEVKGYDSNNLI